MCQEIKSTQKWQRKVEGSETGGEDKNSSNHAFPECIENFEKYVPFTQKFTERVVLNIFYSKDKLETNRTSNNRQLVK